MLPADLHGNDVTSQIGVRVRNSILVMGSSFITASFQMSRNQVGLKSMLFLTFSGMLDATEYSDTPAISQGATWIINSSSERMKDVAGRIIVTWGRKKALFFGCIISLWMMLMSVLRSYCKKTLTQPTVSAPMPSPLAAPVMTTGERKLPAQSITNASATNQQTSLSGATSGVDSGSEDIVDVDAIPTCHADRVLLGSNPRTHLSSTP